MITKRFFLTTFNSISAVLMLVLISSCSSNVNSADNFKYTKEITSEQDINTEEFTDNTKATSESTTEQSERAEENIDNSNDANESTTEKSVSAEISSLTPDEILNLYIESLINGDVTTLNALFSKRMFKVIVERKGSSEGYTNVAPQHIDDVIIKMDVTEHDDGKIKPINNDSVASYTIQFDVFEDTDPQFFLGGVGERFFFVKLIKEDGCWKIDVMATSP